MNFSTFSRSHFLLCNRKQSVMSRRSQEDLSNDASTVKAKSESMNLVSHRNLSIVRQNSRENTSAHVNHVLANAHSSQGEAQLYIFEDNESVIKMIIKGKKSNNETCFHYPPNMLTPKTNSLTF